MPKSRSEKNLISVALRFNFEENLMLMPKEAIFKNHAKPLCFCTFFQHSFISMKRKNDFNTNKIIVKNPMEKRWFFIEIFIILGICFRLKNFAVLGRVLASILASISEHVGLKNQLKTVLKRTWERPSRQLPKNSQVDATWTPGTACKPVQQGTGKHIYSDACDLQTQESKPASKQASKPASNHASKQKKTEQAS